jgi:hypothetical protein
LVIAASRAASWVLRAAAPIYFPFSVDARAVHAVVGLMTSRQPLEPHWLNAICAAFFGVAWFQTLPVLPLSRFQAIAA